MRLLHQGRVIGEIRNVSQDGVWMNADVQLNHIGEELRRFFDYMTDDEQSLAEDPPFGPDLLDSEHWHVEMDGQWRGIDVPAVHSDGIIEWRWR